jgi:glucuronokinase
VRLVRAQANARAALVGNPSDGYGGRTISFTFRQFAARATVYEWPRLEIVPGREDQVSFASLDELVDEVRGNGYYGGLRVVTAAMVRFADWCAANGVELEPRNVSVRYETDIPRGVGLGGSSAIATAVVRALCGFHGVRIPPEQLPSVVLAAETEELGIAAGLQDRVAQAYEGLTYMDFDPALVAERGHGRYERLDPTLLPPLRVAFLAAAAQPSHEAHRAVRNRFRAGDEAVTAAMSEIAALATEAREALEAGERGRLGELMDRNLDLRASVFELDPRHLAMVDAARAAGAHCNYAGSGGALVLLPDPARGAELEGELGTLGCALIEPTV